MLEKQIVEAEKRWEENTTNHIQQVHRLQKEKETSDRTIKEEILQNQNVSTKRVEKSRQQIENIESRFAEGQKQHEHVIEKRIAEINKLQEQSANQQLAEKTKQETEIESRIKTIWQQQEKNTEQRLFKKQKAWKENPVKYMQQVQRMQKEISDRKNMLPGQSTEKQSAGKEETQGKGIENHIVKIQQRVKSAEQQMQRLQEGNDTDYKTGKLLRKQNVVKYSEGKTEESKRQTEDIIKGGTEENIRQKNIFQRMILKEQEGTKGNTGYPLISTVNVRKMPEIVQKGVLDLVKASKNFARFYAVTNEIRNSSYHEKEAAPYHLPVSEENYSAQELYTNGSKSIESRFAQSRNIQYLTGQNDFSETGSTDTLLNNSISFFGNDPFAVYNAYNEKQQWRRQQSEPMVKSGRVHKSVTNTVVSARQQKEIMEQVKELKNIVMQEKQEKLEEKKKVLQLQEILTEQSEKRKEQQTAQQKEKEQLQENAEIRDRMAMYEKAVENEDMLTRMRYGAWN